MKAMPILPMLLLPALLAARAGDIPAATEGMLDIRCAFTVRDIPAGTRTVRFWLPVPRPDPGHVLSGCRLEDGLLFTLCQEPGTGNGFLSAELPVERATNGVAAVFSIVRDPRAPQPADSGFRQVLLVRPAAPGLHPAPPMPPPEAPDRETLRRLFHGQGEGLPAPYVPDGDHRNMRWHAGFIEDLRALGVSARFASGLILTGGSEDASPVIHHWAEFHLPGRGWQPAATLTEDAHGRSLVLSAGRDITAPGSRSGPVEFFTGPLVELDGMAHFDVETAWSVREASPQGVMLARAPGVSGRN